MFLSDYYKEDLKLKYKRKMSFRQLYDYWFDYLLNRCLGMFRYNDLPVNPRHLEIMLLSWGLGGIVKVRGTEEFLAVRGSFYGVTDYPDEYTRFLWTTPKHNGDYSIDEVVVCRNTQIRMPLLPMIERYAYLLSHADLSLQTVLINSRASGIIAADNQNVAKSVKEWYTKLEEGSSMAIVDAKSMEGIIGAQGLRQVANSYPSSTSIKDYYDVSRNILKSFFNDIGIRMSTEKRERLITDEVNSDSDMLLCNIDDMLNERINICNRITELWGIECSVELNRNFDIATGETTEHNGEENDDE